MDTKAVTHDTQAMDASAARPFPVSLWISIGAIVISLAGATMVVLGQFFAPKSIETKLAVIEEKQRTLDWRVEVVRVGQENGTAQIQTLNVNVARLLERLQVEAAPPAAMMAAPPGPPGE